MSAPEFYPGWPMPRGGASRGGGGKVMASNATPKAGPAPVPAPAPAPEPALVAIGRTLRTAIGGAQPGHRWSLHLPGSTPGDRPKPSAGRRPKAQPDAAAPVPPAVVLPVQGVAAGYDPRVQCAPGEQPAGAGFARLGIGRYLGDAAGDEQAHGRGQA